MLIRLTYWSILVLILTVSISLGYRDNSKFLGNDLTDEGRQLGKRRRPGNQGSSPCNFGGGYRRPKNEGSGRTFFDLQYFNVEYNNNLNINCGGQPGYGGNYPSHPAPVTEVHPAAGDHGGHKPPGGFGGGAHRPPHKPHKPGGGPFGNGGGLFGGFFGGGGGNNKPHKPVQGGPFKPGEGEGHPNPGLDTESSGGPFAGIFPSPQQFASGFSEGIQTFVQTIPAIGQSFQSILPSFSDFQWPQLPSFNPGANTGPVTFGPLFQGAGSAGAFTNPFNRPPPVVAPITTTPSIATVAPLTTTTDPDDIIYSDEIKPVHEDYDPITDPYNKRITGNLSPGQYLVISNPHLGSYTHSLSAFNPTNLYNKWQQGVEAVLDEFGNNRRYNTRGRSLSSSIESPYYGDRHRNDHYKSQPDSPRARQEGRGFRFPSS